VTAEEPAVPFPDADTRIPRFLEAGEVRLDLVHRDGRVEACWLGLRPREFELLWRLARKPGERLTRRHLLGYPPAPPPATPPAARRCVRPGRECGGLLALRVARIRAKLAPFGLSRMIAADARGGHFLDAPDGPCAAALAAAPPPRPARAG